MVAASKSPECRPHFPHPSPVAASATHPGAAPVSVSTIVGRVAVTGKPQRPRKRLRSGSPFVRRGGDRAVRRRDHDSAAPSLRGRVLRTGTRGRIH